MGVLLFVEVMIRAANIMDGLLKQIPEEIIRA
jgi:hypothetical protein